jgi:arylsulfatase
VEHVPQLYAVQALVAQQIDGFIKYPPRQKPASFNLDEVLAKVATPHA